MQMHDLHLAKAGECFGHKSSIYAVSMKGLSRPSSPYAGDSVG